MLLLLLLEDLFQCYNFVLSLIFVLGAHLEMLGLNKGTVEGSFLLVCLFGRDYVSFIINQRESE